MRVPKLRADDLLLILILAAPILLFLSYWAAEGFRTPLSQRYSLYVLQDPSLPAIVFVSITVATYLNVFHLEPSERHQEYFSQAVRWFLVPVYLTVVLAIMLWYRYDFGSPFPAESIFLTLGRTLPGALAILLPSLLILTFGILSLSNEQRLSFFHSIVIVFGALLIFSGAFLQYLLQGSATGRVSLGYAGAAAAAYGAMIAGGLILLYSMRRFVKGHAPTPSQEA